MPHPGVSNVDECAVVRFQGDSNVLLQDTIWAQQQPITTIGKNLAAQARPFERSADCRIETSGAARRRTHVSRRCHKAGKTAQKLTPKRFCHCYFPSVKADPKLSVRVPPAQKKGYAMPEQTASTTDLFEIIRTTRSMRRLKPDPVPNELILKILEAGVCAPSGGNMQRWRFLVIRDPMAKATVGALYKRAWDEQVAPRYRAGEPAPGTQPGAV